MNFESSNEQEDNFKFEPEDKIEVLVIIKFILIVVSAIAVVVFALIYIKQLNVLVSDIDTLPNVDEQPNNEIVDENTVLSREERLQIVDTVSSNENADSSVAVEELSVEDREAMLNTVTDNSAEESSISSDERLEILDQILN